MEFDTEDQVLSKLKSISCFWRYFYPLLLIFTLEKIICHIIPFQKILILVKVQFWLSFRFANNNNIEEWTSNRAYNFVCLNLLIIINKSNIITIMFAIKIRTSSRIFLEMAVFDLIFIMSHLIHFHFHFHFYLIWNK